MSDIDRFINSPIFENAELSDGQPFKFSKNPESYENCTIEENCKNGFLFLRKLDSDSPVAEAKLKQWFFVKADNMLLKYAVSLSFMLLTFVLTGRL